ncbi:unnamed protein product [Arctogadus glacialis]
MEDRHNSAIFTRGGSLGCHGFRKQVRSSWDIMRKTMFQNIVFLSDWGFMSGLLCVAKVLKVLFAQYVIMQQFYMNMQPATSHSGMRRFDRLLSCRHCEPSVIVRVSPSTVPVPGPGVEVVVGWLC